MSITDFIANQGIEEVLHFTTNRGLVGILQSHQILSRWRLPGERELAYILRPNVATRPEESEFFDKQENWLDFINMSISEINSRFFRV
jgi:hypothetical protein